MAEAMVKWLEEKRFVGVDSTDHGIVIASPGEDGRIGVKPSDLLLLALGSCTAYDVVSILQKKRQPLTGLEVRVSGNQQADPPWTFERFHVHYVVKGRGLSEKAVADAIRLSEEKYCSVSATLRLGATVTHDYEIVEDGQP
jgi:putative redox protein